MSESENTGASASGFGAVIGCPTSLALPQAYTTGVYAERGNILHNYCRLIGLDPANRKAALDDIKDEKIRSTAEKIDLTEAFENLKIEGFERAYILDAKNRTVRVVGDNLNRNYGERTKYEVPATVDVVGIDNEGVPVEMDYKSGMYIGDPAEHWQRKICATALMIHYGTPTAKSRVAYIKEDGQIFIDPCEFSCMDIDDICDTICDAIDRVHLYREMLAAGKMPPVFPSDSNCKWCNAITSCPYYTNLAKSLLGTLKAVRN